MSIVVENRKVTIGLPASPAVRVDTRPLRITAPDGRTVRVNTRYTFDSSTGSDAPIIAVHGVLEVPVPDPTASDSLVGIGFTSPEVAAYAGVFPGDELLLTRQGDPDGETGIYTDPENGIYTLNSLGTGLDGPVRPILTADYATYTVAADWKSGGPDVYINPAFAIISQAGHPGQFDFSPWVTAPSGATGVGDQERNVRIVTTSTDAANTDGVIVLANPGDYNLTLPATGFDDGQTIEVWGASPADTCMVITPADLYLLDGSITGANIIVSDGQVLRFSFFTAVDTSPSWRLTYDSFAASGGAVSSVDGRTGAVTLSDLYDAAGTASSAVSTHTGATDPHGDRAYAAGLVDDLSGVTNASTARANLGLGSAATSNTSAFEAAGAVSTHAAASDPHGDRADAAATYVAKALFDAQTVLAATSDNTPAAVTVGEQTLVGRITGGNIAALTASQVRTLLALVIGTNVQAWDADLDAIAALATTTFGRARLTEASGWVPISDTLVSNSGSGVASISVSCSGYRYLRCRFKGRSLKSSTTTDTLVMTVNSDTNSRYSINGGSLTTGWSISSSFVASNTNTDRMGSSNIEVGCGNSSWSTVVADTETPTSTSTLSVARGQIAGIFNQTTAISSIQFAFSGGNIADGSSLIVEGWA